MDGAWPAGRTDLFRIFDVADSRTVIRGFPAGSRCLHGGLNDSSAGRFVRCRTAVRAGCPRRPGGFPPA